MATPDSGTHHGSQDGQLTPDTSFGALVSNLTVDLQKLVRQEVALAKTELRREAVKAGSAAGMLGIAGFALYMVAIVGSFAAVFGLANLMDLAWAALIVVGAWLLIAVVLVAVGLRLLRRLSLVPERTIQTLRDGVRWAKELRA